MEPTNTTVNEPVNEMFVDTDSFDIFANLDDLQVEEKEFLQAEAEGVQDEEVEEAAEDVDSDDEDYSEDEDEDFNFEDIEDGDEEESYEDEEEDDSEEVEEDFEGLEDSEEDGEEVDYEGYEVTLPNGEVVPLDAAVKSYKETKALEQERAAFQEEVETFQENAKYVNRALELAKLESDRVIEDYKDFDWATLSREDPQAYVENREFLDSYLARRKELVAEIENRSQLEEQERAAQLQTKARNCVAELQNSIPDWSEGVYQELITYAIDNGADREEILADTNPTTFKVLYKALQYEKGKRVIKAKVKKAVKSPKKVVKSTSRKASKPSSKKATISKKLASGNFDDSDLRNAFDFLED